MDKKNTSEKENKKDKKSLIIIILLLLIIGLISYFGFFAKSDTDDTLAVDQTQSEYVKPETNAVEVDGTVLDVSAGTNTGETAMGFKLSTTTDTAEKAGFYTDQLKSDT